MASVIVLRTLRDIVKKISELESIEDRKPSRDTTVQMIAYYKVLEEWPVLDTNRVALLTSRFKIQTANFKQAEKDLEAILKVTPVHFPRDDVEIHNEHNAVTAAKRYSYLKKQIRDTYNELNSLGKYIGNPPTVLEIDNGETGKESNLVSGNV